MEQLIREFAKLYLTNGLQANRVPLKALVVDDSSSMRTQLLWILSSVGYEVCEASNVESGILQYRRQLPNVVTLDLVMPGMGGLEGLTEFLQWDNQASIVVVSSEGYKEAVLRAISNGAKNFVRKPINEDSLEKMLTVVKSVAIAV
ncbi:response regulator, partial [bacterium]|nr:response regulator [bacterium]